jgi:DNA-directed RNA polymerase subunit RPC12/RpoP
MSEQSVHGLSCPRCGGMVPIPEGQAVVICPYCDLRSLVAAQESAPALPDASSQQSSETQVMRRGVRRYQAPLRTTREAAEDAFRRFLSGKFQVARDASREAKLSEVFLVNLPFWAVWGRGVAWAFGQQQVGSSKNRRYEPREKKVVKEMDYNCPACEVGEFGVRQISLKGCPLEPFDAAELHRTGMVFEPVGSSLSVLEAARESFMESVKDDIKLDRTEQIIARLTRPRLGLVYYPLWVLRYLYHGRSFQVVVDGFNGDVLYGKAPGSVSYRAGVLVGGMAVGAVVTVDVPVLLLLTTSSDEDGPLVIALAALLAGLGILYGAYRTFRHGEHYEYHRYGKPKGSTLLPGLPDGLPGNVKDFEMIARNLGKLT